MLSDRVKCRKCGQMIRFIDLPSGKKMPVDSPCRRVYETKPGNLFYTKDGEAVEGIQTEREDLPRVACYTPHFPNCRRREK